MQRLTVDYGIDLGTTNSVIAVREKDRVAIIPNKGNAVVTPSAIYLDKRGQIYVGDAARSRAVKEPENVAAVFKRTMGQGPQAVKSFQAAGKSMSPEELSAEILKSLRGDVRDKRGEDLRDIVITVPADFDSGQCAATKAAAELAGFRTCTLLLEPIAAALAYGFDKLDRDAYWLMYDFGGGTFDAAVVQIDDGVPKVVNHAGNNYLGGTNIDRDLAEKKLIPALRKKHDLAPYDASTPFWALVRAKLQFAAEAAKVEICRTKRPFGLFVEELCEDRSGKDIDFEHTLTPDDVREVTKPYLAQTLELCKRALAEKQMDASQIDKVIMVGGSTLSPWVREGVMQGLGRPLEISIDPMTVVAEGAAVLASTIKVPAAKQEELPVGTYSLDIKSPLSVSESPADFAAIVVPPAGGQLDRLTFEAIEEAATGWHTGKVPVRDGGRINTKLRLGEQKDATFLVELRAADGTLLPCSPSRIPIHWGVEDFEVPLTASIGVGMANGKMDVFLERGTPLPARSGLVLHVTTKALLRGAKSEPLIIPLYEGPNIERVVRNRLLISIEVHGDQIVHDLPVGSEVEIELECDRSRQLTAKVHFPAVEYHVPQVKVDFEKTMPAPSVIRSGLEAQNKRLNELRRSAGNVGGKATSVLRNIETQDFVRRIEDCLRNPNDADQRGNAERLLRDFATALDELEDLIAFPQEVNEVRETLEAVSERVERIGKPGDRRLFQQIKDELEQAAATGDMVRLRGCRAELSRLMSAIIDNDIQFWVGFFAYLQERKGLMKDANMAEMLLRQGLQAIERDDLDALKAACRQLNGLLPSGTPVPPQFGFGPVGHTQRR